MKIGHVIVLCDTHNVNFFIIHLFYWHFLDFRSYFQWQEIVTTESLDEISQYKTWKVHSFYNLLLEKLSVFKI